MTIGGKKEGMTMEERKDSGRKGRKTDGRTMGRRKERKDN